MIQIFSKSKKNKTKQKVSQQGTLKLHLPFFNKKKSAMWCAKSHVQLILSMTSPSITSHPL